jgi:hypothetical protein
VSWRPSNTARKAAPEEGSPPPHFNKPRDNLGQCPAGTSINTNHVEKTFRQSAARPAIEVVRINKNNETRQQKKKTNE